MTNIRWFTFFRSFWNVIILINLTIAGSASRSQKKNIERSSGKQVVTKALETGLAMVGEN